MRLSVISFVIFSVIAFGSNNKNLIGSQNYITLEGMPTMQKSIIPSIFYTDTFPQQRIPVYMPFKVDECELSRILREIEYFPQSFPLDSGRVSFFNYTIYCNGKINRLYTDDSKNTLKLLNGILGQIKNKETKRRFHQRIIDMGYYFN